MPVSYTVTAADNCDPRPVVSCIPPSGSLFSPGITTVACSGTDSSGNRSTCSFSVEIVPPACSDLAAPRLVSVYATCDKAEVLVTFDEPVSPLSAANVTNYELTCAGNPVPLLDASIVEGLRIVRVITALPMISGAACRLVVRGLFDACGNRLDRAELTFSCSDDSCPGGSSRGTEFWLTFPGNFSLNPLSEPTPKLFIMGDPGTLGTVSAPGLAVPFFTNFFIPSNRIVTLVLPRDADLAGASDAIQTKGICIVANRPVTVSGHNEMPGSTDSYLAFPTSLLGTNHIVMAYQNVFDDAPELNGTQLAIVATRANSTIRIIPSANVGTHQAGTAIQLTLERGQTYQLTSTADPPADLTGTIISADKPVAVFGSHQCAAIPSKDTFYCDHLVEQLPPIEMWSTEFNTIPLATRSGGDVFRILAGWDNTTVRVNGTAVGDVLARGRFHQLVSTTPLHITADKPVLVAQFANSSDVDQVLSSDPFMVMVPAVASYSASYFVEIPPTNDFNGNYVNLVVFSNWTAAITIDGRPVGGWRPIPASTFAGTQVLLEAGPHVLSSSSEIPFGAIVYGWNRYMSYGHPAGFCYQTGPPFPFLSVSRFNTEILLSFATSSGRGYAVEFKTRLDELNWSVLTSGLGDGKTKVVRDQIPNRPSRFYRLRLD